MIYIRIAKEKKARTEDALYSIRAAVEEGIVPNGGVVPVRSLQKIDGLTAGYVGQIKQLPTANTQNSTSPHN